MWEVCSHILCADVTQVRVRNCLLGNVRPDVSRQVWQARPPRSRRFSHRHFLALAAFCAPTGTFAFPKPTLSFAFGLAFTGASGLIVASVPGGAPNSAISIPNTSASFEASSTLALL